MMTTIMLCTNLIINKLNRKRKMERKRIFNILSCFLLFTGFILSSCSNNDLENENIPTGTRMITFDVSQSFNESPDESIRGLSVKHDTVFQKLDTGLEIEAFIEEDKIEKSRASTIEAVAPGTKVLAFVVDAATHELYRIQELEVSNDNKLSCEVPNLKTLYIRLYSYNSTEMPTTVAKEGDNVFYPNTFMNEEEYTKDVMFYYSPIIYENTTTLGSIKFRHGFSRLRICLHCDTGILGFTSVLNNLGIPYADVDPIYGNVLKSAREGQTSLQLNSEQFTSPQTIVYSSYATFIPQNDTLGELQLNINNSGIIGTIKIKCGFRQQYSYTVHENVKKAVSS